MIGEPDKGTGADARRLVTLSARQRPAGPSAMAQLEAYWRELRGSGPLPRRADLNPSRIEAALPHAFLLERVSGGDARMRLAGQALCRHLGLDDARGLPLSVLFASTAWPTLARWVDRCFDAPALVDATVRARISAFRPPLDGRLLLLPMLDTGGEVTRILGGLFLDDPAGRSRGLLDLPEGAPSRCEVIREPVGCGARMQKGLSEAERPFLRLVVSN